MADDKPVLMSRQQIRDQMIQTLLDGSLFPHPQQHQWRELGHTAATKPNSTVGTLLYVLSESLFQYQMQVQQMMKDNTPEG